MNEPNANYDEPWKEALGDYFESFLSFFFPSAHALIDWSKPPQSLDKELQQISASAESGKRLADKLFQVWLLNQQEVWLLVHIEVQSQYEANFAQRIYIYNYRAFDLYQKPVISLVVLGDERPSWRPSSYGYQVAGCEVSLKFPTVKLLDYQSRWSELEQDINPFAMVVMAHLKTKVTTGDLEAREEAKWSLVKQLYEKGLTTPEIIKLFQVIDTMMSLPEELQSRFEEKLSSYEEERKMPLMSNIERRGLQRGLQQGIQSSIIAVLQKRFGTISEDLIKTINQIEDIPKLQELHLETVSVSSLNDFQNLLS